MPPSATTRMVASRAGVGLKRRDAAAGFRAKLAMNQGGPDVERKEKAHSIARQAEKMTTQALSKMGKVRVA